MVMLMCGWEMPRTCVQYVRESCQWPRLMHRQVPYCKRRPPTTRVRGGMKQEVPEAANKERNPYLLTQ